MLHTPHHTIITAGVVAAWRGDSQMRGHAPQGVREGCAFLDAVQQGSAVLPTVPSATAHALMPFAFTVAIWNNHMQTVHALLALYGAHRVNAWRLWQSERWSLLTQASFFGYTAMMVQLVEASADVECAGAITPLYAAIVGRHASAVSLLLAAKTQLDHPFRKPPLHWATQMGNTDIVALLLEAKANVESNYRDQTPLLAAIKSGQAGAASALLQAKAEVDSDRASTWSPLLEAAWRGYTPCVAVLLEHMANVNFAAFSSGSTALHWAVQNGHVSTVAVLFQAKAGVATEDRYSQTPLSIARRLKRTDILELFVDA